MHHFIFPLFALCFSTACMAATDPCQEVKKQCIAAGYKPGGHTSKGGKGLIIDCLEPILAGKSVDKVVVKNADIESCKASKKGK